MLDSLHDADRDFTESHGKPNTELLAQRELVAELIARLSEERAKLDVIEARGSSVDRLNAAVQVAESQFQVMLSRAENEEIQRLATNLYGWNVPFDQLSPERKREFRLHSSIIGLNKLHLPLYPNKTEDVALLQSRLQWVGERTVKLRDMLEYGSTLSDRYTLRRLSEHLRVATRLPTATHQGGHSRQPGGEPGERSDGYNAATGKLPWNRHCDRESGSC